MNRSLIAAFCLLFLPPALNAGGLLFFIDPGHGPAQPGVALDSLDEQRAVFIVAKEMVRQLKAEGIDSLLSRDEAGTPSLAARVAAANAAGASAFISLHINASPSPAVRGVRIFAPKAVAATSDGGLLHWNRAAGAKAETAKELGSSLAASLSESVAGRSPVQSLDLANFKGLSMPAILIELGYASHAESRERLSNPEHLKGLGARLARGLESWASSHGGQP